MGQQRIPFNSFTTGQSTTDDFAGPAIEGRFDSKLYLTAARTVRNFIPLVTGACMFRPGFKFMDSNSAFLRLIEYRLSPGRDYLFAFKHSGQMDVYRLDSGTPVLTAANVTHPWGSGQLPRLRSCQWGAVWIGFTHDVPPTSIEWVNDASWTVAPVAFSTVFQWDFGSGAEDAWSVTRGYPTVGCTHQDRLIIGGSPALPGSVFGSTIGQFKNFGESVPVKPEEAFGFTMASDQNEIILDLASFNDTLFINTASSEWIERSQPMSAQNVNFQKQSNNGLLSTGVRPENVDSGLAFVDKRSTMRILNYNDLTRAYEGEDMNTLTPGLLQLPTASGFVRKFERSSNLFVFRDSETSSLAILTYDKKSGVQAWSQTFAAEGLGFLDICPVNDSLYALISDGSTVYLSRLTNEVYLDLWKTATSGSPTKTFSGFSHLNGKTVSVINNTGGVINGIVVTGGNITVPNACTQIWAGLPYSGLLESLPICPILQEQVMRGQEVNLIKADVMVRNTSGLKVNGGIVPLDKLGPNLLDQFTPSTSQTLPVLLDGFGIEPTLKLENNGPWPFMTLGFIVTIETASPQR